MNDVSYGIKIWGVKVFLCGILRFCKLWVKVDNFFFWEKKKIRDNMFVILKKLDIRYLSCLFMIVIWYER